MEKYIVIDWWKEDSDTAEVVFEAGLLETAKLKCRIVAETTDDIYSMHAEYVPEDGSAYKVTTTTSVVSNGKRITCVVKTEQKSVYVLIFDPDNNLQRVVGFDTVDEACAFERGILFATGGCEYNTVYVTINK